MRPTDELRAYVRFAAGLRSFLKERLDADGVRRAVAERLANRESNLIEVVRRCIYPHAASPYRILLEWAGCELGDFRQLVRAEGVEGALNRLREQGVYVSVDEFKVKRPVRRGSAEFFFREQDFDNPLSKGTLVAKSGGSRSRGLRTVYDFRNLADSWSAHFLLRLEAHGLLGHPFGIWYPVMPGAGPLVVLSLAKLGIFVKWFSPLKPGSIIRNLRSRAGNAFVIWWGKQADQRISGPEFVPFESPERILDWITSQLADSGRCTLMTYVSAAVRISRAAVSRGVDLGGTTFSVTSEPITRAKRSEMEASGAAVLPSFATMEAGTIGVGCPQGGAADEMHLLDDTISMISHRRRVEPGQVEVDALLVTGLLESFPKVLFNTETGDCGELEWGKCGCGIGRLGFDRRLRNVFGFDKLTAGGMTFVGTDLVRILDEFLPSHFGGSSLDYQLVEKEEAGQTRMILVVSPALGPIDPPRIKRLFLKELSRGSEANRLMSRMWDESETLLVKRDSPNTTTRGKLLPLHIDSPRNG